MYLRYVILVFTCSFLGAFAQNTLPNIGDKYNSDQNNTSMIMASSSQFYSEEQLTLNDIRFSLGLDDSKIVRFISTNDSTFNTPEGIKVGSLFSEVITHTNNELQREPGWSFFILLPSGWFAGFTKGESMTEGDIQNEDRVVWLFKR